MPNSKTAAAVRGQAPVLVANLLALLDSQPLAAAYDGYSCCPLITGYVDQAQAVAWALLESHAHRCPARAAVYPRAEGLAV